MAFSSSAPLTIPGRRPTVGGRGALGLRLAAVLIGLLFSAPMIYVVIQNIDLGADLGELLSSSKTWWPLLRSLWLGTTVAGSAAVVGTALAWVLVRTDLPGRRVFRVLAPLPLVFPSFVGAAALISAFATGGLLERVVSTVGIGELPQLRGFWAAWMVLTLFTYPYVFLPVAGRLRHLPRSLEESGRLLGRSPLSVFTSIVFPQIRPAVSAGTLLVFLYTISDFGAVQLLRYDTITRVIFSNQLADRATFFALSLLITVVALTVVSVERALVRGDRPVAGRSSATGLVVPLGRWRWPSFIAVAAVMVFALVGPVASLAHWTQRGIGSGRTSGALAVETSHLFEALTNTVFVSILTALVSVVVVLPVAYLSVRRRSRIGDASNSMIVAGFALPGLVSALSLVFWVLRSPWLGRFYQTLPLLILAYMLHFGAQASRASQVAVAAVGRSHEEAARTLGAGRLRRLMTVELPAMLPGLLAASGLVLLSTMKELPATLFLAPTGFRTLTSEIWASMDNVSYAQAGLESMVLLAASAVLTWVLVIRSADHLD